jgi:hypothetical protein
MINSTICHSGKSRNLSNVYGIPASAGMTKEKRQSSARSENGFAVPIPSF